MNMAISGYYDGKVIRTPYVFDEGQKVLIIPISSKVNQDRLEKFNSLKGIINSNVSLEEIREERLKKYEDINCSPY